MNCETVEELLLDYVEGELPEQQNQTVLSHIESCKSCSRSLEETRRLIQAIEAAKRDAPTGGLQEKTQGEQSGKAATGQSRTTSSGDSSRNPDEHGAAEGEPFASKGRTSRTKGETLGDFEILDEIGRGGMGIVYRARQVSLNRIVALKVLPGVVCQTGKSIRRFKNEAQAAARLQHTNIVPVYAQGEHDGRFYFAMKLIEGISLDRVLEKEPSLILPTLSEAVTRQTPADQEERERRDSIDATSSGLRADYRRMALLISGVAEGLEHAHRQGVIHRDIKPQNLLLGSDGLLHIADFGLARLLDEPSVTVTGEMLGTPAYMSPEQVGGDRAKIGHRTDIYSLGVTFYELLTKHRPFEGSTREQIVARICTDEPKPPRKWNPNIPIDLETICLRAMDRDRRRRYASARDMAADLRRYAEDRPILSRRVGPFEKAVKWVRRHPATTAIVTLSLLLLATASFWIVQSINARHDRANNLVHRAFEALAIVDYREPEQPRQWLDEAGTLGPNDVSFQVKLRVALAMTELLNHPELAVSHLEWAISKQPGDTEIMYLLAWALRRADQDQASHEWVRKAEAAGGATTAPGHFFHAQTIVRTNPDEAEEAYRKAMGLRDVYVQAMVHLGRAHNHWTYHNRKLERFAEQKRILINACEYRRDKAYPRYLLSIAYRLAAEIYEEAGEKESAETNFAGALKWAKEAQEKEPRSLRGYACEAEHWESRRDYPRAIAAWDRGEPFCDTPKLQVELNQYRWRLLYWNGQLDRAKNDLTTLARACPGSDVKKLWYVALFPALIRAEQGEMDEALRLARSMAESSPTDFRAITTTACLLRVLHRENEANKLLSRHADRIDYSAATSSTAPPGWNEAVYSLCQGTRSWEALERLAGDRGTDKLLWPAAHFVTACRSLSLGEWAEASDAFKRCERTYDYDDYCYMAKVFVRRLEDDPSWPSWLLELNVAQPRPLADSSGAAGSNTESGITEDMYR